MASIPGMLALALSATFLSVHALNPIIVQEQEFIDSVTNQRFMVLGVDYQPGGQGAYNPVNTADPLSNGTICLRDAALMQNLGVNTIRSYNVDPALSHDECASIFNMAGIYMILDVNSPLGGQSIDRADPASTYNTAYLSHIFGVVEAFKSYPNTLGFFAGNEIINSNTTATQNPQYIRAVQRDLKNYISAHASRPIPVGYSAADIREVLQDTWAYLQCDNSANGTDISRSDFFGLNSYSWCGSGSSFQTSGYDQLVAIFSNTTIPVFFSEYGCNDPQPRVFDEVTTLYGPEMTVMSGGLVYEWTQETANYGIITTFPNDSAQLRGDYDALEGKYSQLNLTLIESRNSTATNLQPPKCNSNLISADGFSTNFDIPSAPDGADALIAAGISTPPTGSIVFVTQTAVQVQVLASNGAMISGLSITSASGANKPGDGSLQTGALSRTTSGAASSTGGVAAATSSAAAVQTAISHGIWAAGCAGAMAVLVAS
ncbi:Glycolipid anchored surface protein 4 precursor [Oleoguttula sp. CCFEE 5521]